MSARTIGIAMATVLTACSLFEPNANARDRLARAMDRWNAQGSVNYEITLRYSCGECLPSWSNLLRIRVVAGQITTVEDLTAGTTIPPDQRARTVPALFGFVQDALQRQAYRLAVEYHATLGYPLTVAVDYDKQTVDDEGGFQVTELVLLSQTAGSWR